MFYHNLRFEIQIINDNQIKIEYDNQSCTIEGN